jgi:hypothetical protein
MSDTLHLDEAFKKKKRPYLKNKLRAKYGRALAHQAVLPTLPLSRHHDLYKS